MPAQVGGRVHVRAPSGSTSIYDGREATVISLHKTKCTVRLEDDGNPPRGTITGMINKGWCIPLPPSPEPPRPSSPPPTAFLTKPAKFRVISIKVDSGKGAATLSWMAAQPTNCVLQRYSIKYMIGNELQGRETPDANATSHRITGLSCGECYTFQIAAHATGGLTARATSIAVEVPHPPAPPPAPAPEPPVSPVGMADPNTICPKTTKSYALVIGNNYPGENELKSCVNDANAVGAALDQAGFIDVTVAHNLDAVSIKRALRELRDKATEGSVVLVYFSGHGHSEGGDNFVVPTRMGCVATKQDWLDEAIATAYILTMMAQSKAKAKLLIIDACRSRGRHDTLANTSVKSAFDGAKMSWAAVNQSDAGMNMYSIFSSAEATVSYAGGSNDLSVMTRRLVPLITQEPGLELSSLVKCLSAQVLAAHGSSNQGRMLVNSTPQAWMIDFYFMPPSVGRSTRRAGCGVSEGVQDGGADGADIARKNAAQHSLFPLSRLCMYVPWCLALGCWGGATGGAAPGSGGQ